MKNQGAPPIRTNLLLEGLSGMIDVFDEHAFFERPRGISRTRTVSGRAYNFLKTSNVHRAVFETFS